MKISKKDLYSRQTVLPEIGESGQEALLSSRVAIVGCGGLGGLVAVQLAASGVGSLHLIDYDLVSVSNLHRQIFYRPEDVGAFKAEVLSGYLRRMSPFVEVTTSTKALTKNNIDSELGDFDLVIDCTDSLSTKFLLNDYCVISGKVLVYGSLYKHDGYVSSFNLPGENRRSANLRDAFAGLPQKSIPNCSEVGTLNAIVGLIATLQTNEAIKILAGIGSPLANRLLIYNSLHNSQFTMSLTQKVTRDEIMNIFHEEAYYEPRCATQDEALLIHPDQLRKRMGEVEILSVIEDSDLLLPFGTDQWIPYSGFQIEKVKMPEGKDLVIVCRKGITSYEVTRQIKSMYDNRNIYSLSGGIEGYSEEVP